MSIEILKNALNEGRFGKIENNIAYLKEDSRDAELKLIKVDKVPQEALLLSCDKVDTQTLFKKGNGQNMRCDYILLSNGFVYFLELKTSSKADETYKDECIKKFKAVGCLMDYIDTVISEFYKKDKLFCNCQKRYILLYKAPSINKTLTSLKSHRKTLHDNPEEMLTLPVDNEAVIDLTILTS